MLHNVTLTIQRVAVADGRIAVEVVGSGPLIVCIPGIGDLRSSFRHLLPGLVSAGYRVATIDLRGHGDSDVGFSRYDGAAVAADTLAVIEWLGEDSAIVLGNSFGADAAVQAAALAPETITTIILVGPAVRDSQGTFGRALLGAMLARPWGPWLWRGYFARLTPTGGPSDLSDHQAAAAAALARPGHWSAFRTMATASHAPAEAALAEVQARALVVMGERDPDWKDPAAEAAWIAGRLHAPVAMIPEAGHYPHAERAQAVLDAVQAFLGDRRAGEDAPRG